MGQPCFNGSEVDLEIHYKPGWKHSCADALSNSPSDSCAEVSQVDQSVKGTVARK